MNQFSHGGIVDVDGACVVPMAQALTRWQKHKEFNNFLRETPGGVDQNIHFLQQKMSGDIIVAKAAQFAGEIAGIILLHSFNEEDASLEESIRIAPEFQGKGLGTMLKQAACREALENPRVSRIISWHSAFNKGTFFTNAKSGGKVVDFVEKQTFLPNIDAVTDDFKWEIERVLSTTIDGFRRSLETIADPRIQQGLQKYNFLT